MAVTGTGIISDPYVVHSYDEIKAVFTNRTTYPITDNMLYIKLDNDIDCKTYGYVWTWSTIVFATSTTSDRFTFDLNNHTIKNFKVTQSNYVFDGANTDYWDSNRIQNGIIKNVYLQSATGFSNRGIKYENVGVSIFATNMSGNQMFQGGTKFKRCGLNIIWNMANQFSKCLLYWGSRGGSSTQGIFEYCNIHLNIMNPKDGLWGCDYEDYPLKDCKITGSIVKSQGDEWILTRGGLRNCIIDLEVSRGDGVTSSYTLSHYSSYSITNKDKLGTGISHSTTTGATSEQIVNGDWLRGQGFPVVNVSSP